MLLVTGPPGSGKTSVVLERVRELLRARREDFRLLTPTATMAEYLRNRLAREGLVFRPGLVATFSKFVTGYVPELKQASPAILQRIVERVLDRQTPPEFREVAEFPGFRTTVTSLFNEFALAGCDAARVAELFHSHGLDKPYGHGLVTIFKECEDQLARRGLVLRSAVIRAAGERIDATGLDGISEILLDGFESFSDLELTLIKVLTGRAETIITLPVSPGAESTRERLLAEGFTERTVNWVRSAPGQTLFAAPTATQEAEEIARRILLFRDQSKPFREIGVIVRTEHPTVPALRSAFDRFGIPARFYFPERLDTCPAVVFLSGLMDAMFADWDHETTLAALQAGYGAAAGFGVFDHAVREQLPGKGLESLRQCAGSPLPLDRLEEMSAWRKGVSAPSVWAERLASLVSLFSPPEGAITPEMVDLWRKQSWALREFQAVVRAAAEAFESDDSVTLEGFWREAKALLKLAELRVPDHRRDVVHVLDVQEARQWELPVVFVCGLLEKQFPKYHSQNPLFPDDARGRLNAQGMRLRTSAEMQDQERFLYEVAESRATEATILSYSRFNAKGDENLPSFFLKGAEPENGSVLVRPRPRWERAAHARAGLAGSPVLAWIAARHRHFGATSIEVFLSCPFHYFMKKTLGIQPPPVRPEERLDASVKGSVVHSAIQTWHRDGGAIGDILDGIYDEELRNKRIPTGFRTEFERLTMRRVLEQFAADPHLLEGWTLSMERDFDLDLREDVRVRGRIDRLQESPSGEVAVLDYKYSGKRKLDGLIEGHEAGTVVQAAVYLLAAAKMTGRTPVGMFYWSLKAREKDKPIRGWKVGLADFPHSESMTPEAMQERLESAAQTVLTAVDAIRAGAIDATPNEKACEYCDFHDACRARFAAVAELAAGGDE